MGAFLRQRNSGYLLARMLYYLAAQPELPDLSEGLCVGSPDADDWHADMHRDAKARARARAVCMQCPVLDACREYALKDESVQGTWGGLTEQERIRWRNGLGLPVFVEVEVHTVELHVIAS